MRQVLVLAVVLSASCKGGGDNIEVEPVSFKERTAPNGVLADLPAAVVGAHDAQMSLWGTMALVASDPGVLDVMEQHGGQSRAGHCWQSTPILSIGVDVDYSSCDLAGITGAVTVERTPAGGPLVMAFDESFQYGNRSIVGNIGFDVLPGVNYAWATSPVTPTGQPAGAPLGVGIGGEIYEVDLGGHAALDFINGRIVGWGNVDITGPEGTATVTYGSSDPAVADAVSATPSTMKVPFYPICRCMVGGLMAYDTTVTLTEVDLSISRALEDAGTLWPDIPVPTSIEIEGKLVLGAGSECGRWDATFEPSGDIPVLLPGADLRAAIEGACTAAAFDSEALCEAVRQASASLDSIELNLDENDFAAMANELADRQFDNGFCSF